MQEGVLDAVVVLDTTVLVTGNSVVVTGNSVLDDTTLDGPTAVVLPPSEVDTAPVEVATLAPVTLELTPSEVVAPDVAAVNELSMLDSVDTTIVLEPLVEQSR